MEQLMIMATVPLGYSDKVIKAANKAGARGATILRARGTEKPTKEGLFSFKIEPEEEIVLIVTNKDLVDVICDAVHQEFVTNCKRGGSIFILPVVEDAINTSR